LLYDESGYFCDMRAWAKARADPWYILSAKHGLVNRSEIIAPYDERGLSESQAEAIAADLAESGVDTAHITAGRDYTDPLVPELERRGIDVVNHFSGLQIGERRHALQEATKELRNQTL
jgi:hypothetical protein